MAILSKLFGREKELATLDDQTIVSVCDGEMISTEDIEDPVFAQEMMGKTVGFLPQKGDIVSPVNGIIETILSTGHAFGVRGADGTGYLVHIGIDTVSLNGTGFIVLKKEGDKVNAGELVVKADLNKIKSAGYKTTTMLIVSEPAEGRVYAYTSPAAVKAGQIISKM